MYRYVTKGETFVNGEYIEVYYGETLGCGCCSSREVLTVDNLKKHIARLEDMLVDAKKVLVEIERNGNTPKKIED